MNPAELNQYQPVATFEKHESSHFNKMEKGSPSRQFMAGIIVNLASVMVGTSLGWTSPISPKFASKDTTPLDTIPSASESSWIASLVALGALIAPFIAGPLAERIGRKYTLLGSSAFFIVSWVLLLTTQTVVQVLVARFLQGLGVGFVMTVQTMYIGEIASSEYRGALGSLMQLCIVTGILYVYTIGPYVSYHALQWACLVLPIAFDATFFFMPETPAYYISKGDKEKAVESLCFLRGKTVDGVQEELHEISTTVEESLKNKGTVMDLFRNAGNVKALIICAGLISFQQLSGINVILFYSQNIFESTGSSLAPAVSTILVGAVQVLASGATPLIVDRLGRKPILLTSAGGMCISLGTMGLYFFLKHTESPSIESLGWLPIMSLIVFVTVYCIGFGPLPWAVLGEMFPANVKSIASSIVASTCWVLGFIILQFFADLDKAVGSHWSFWIFGILCAVAFVFTFTTYLAAILANLSVVCTGCAMGWTSPVESKLSHPKHSPLPTVPTDGEFSWIGSILALGSLAGPPVAGYIAHRFGRKMALLCGGLLFAAAFILFVTAHTVAQILVGRFLQGCGVGFALAITPLYVCEIATAQRRGSLGSLVQVSMTLGMLLVYSVGPYVSYTAMQYILLAVPVLFCLAFSQMPETPHYYVAHGRYADASRSLEYLRGESIEELQDEFGSIQRSVEESIRNRGTIGELFRDHANRRALFICTGIIVLQQLSGINPVQFFTQTIFEKTGTAVRPELASIIIGGVQVVASMITVLTLDKLGRRPYLLISSGGMCCALVSLGTYFYLDTQRASSGLSLDRLAFLPVLSLVVFTAAFCLGFGPIAWLLIGEMFAPNIKSFASSIVSSTCWGVAFFVLFYFSSLDAALGTHWLFWTFAICTAGAFLFTYLFVIETKGMSLPEIQAQLNETARIVSNDKPIMRWRYCELLAGAAANIATVSVGCGIAWPSPVFQKLTDPTLLDNPFGVILTERDQMWSEAGVAIGGLVGPLLGCWIAKHKGPRIALLLSSVLYIAAWLVLMIVGSISLLIVARTTVGMANGYVLLTVTLYIGEIASDRYRGALGCFIQIGTTLGIMVVYCAGPFVSYLALQAICCTVPILFGTLFLYMPETPHYLVQCGHGQRAVETLVFLRGARNADEVRPELEEIREFVRRRDRDDGTPTRTIHHLKHLFSGAGNRKALLISFGLVMFQQCSGIDVILSNSEALFRESNASLGPVYGTIVLGVLQLLSSCITPFFIDRTGRRPLLLASSIGLAIALATLGAYFSLNRYAVPAMDAIRWLPLTSLIAFVALYNGGFGPVAWAIVMEIFDHELKPIGVTLCVLGAGLFDYAILQLLTALIRAAGLDWAFWMLAGICIAAVPFCWKVVIETRALKLHEIQQRLAGVKVVRL
uniref:Facilitated trehalose transporter Tret1 n=1 Tax=Anopheles epiroticus TaxID=199890 RepID=A0A182P8W7_9DIPT